MPDAHKHYNLTQWHRIEYNYNKTWNTSNNTVYTTGVQNICSRYLIFKSDHIGSGYW